MQIEFIGCTSAGKSTLLRELLQGQNDPARGFIQGDDFILQKLRLGWAARFVPRGVLVNLVALPACLLAWRRNRDLVRFAVRQLRDLPISRRDKRYMLRNVLKKIGAQAIIRRFDRGGQGDESLVLVDEGILQIVHNLFVHLGVGAAVDPPTPEQVAAFVDGATLPQVVVYLRRPDAVLLERILHRGHARIGHAERERVADFVRGATATFDTLVAHPAVARRLLRVETDRRVVAPAGELAEPQVLSILRLLESRLAVAQPAPPIPGPMAARATLPAEAA